MFYHHSNQWRRESYYANRSILGTEEEVSKERHYLVYELESNMLLYKIKEVNRMCKEHHQAEYDNVNDFIMQEYRYELLKFYRSCRAYQHKIKTWWKEGDTKHWKREVPVSLKREIGDKEYGWGNK